MRRRRQIAMALPLEDDAPPVRPRLTPHVRIVPRTAQQRASRIRWDRVSRFGLLVVLLGILALYVKPVHSFWATRGQAARTHGEVVRLQRENERLSARAKSLHQPAALERQARRLGMVHKGDRAYVVKGLPKGP